MSIDRGDMRRFWYAVTKRLDQLSNRISPGDRQRIVASIVERIGGAIMTADEMERFDRERMARGRLAARRWRREHDRPSHQASP